MSKSSNTKLKISNILAIILAVIFLGIGCIYCGVQLFAKTDDSFTIDESTSSETELEEQFSALNHNTYVSTNAILDMAEKIACAMDFGFGFIFLLIFLKGIDR